MTTMGRAKAVVTLVGLTAIGWVACGPTGRTGGGVLMDAGGVLTDVGRSMTDGAAAQMTFDGTCVAHTGSYTTGGNTYETTWYVADIAAPTLNPSSVDGLDVILCGHTSFDTTTAGCPAGATCSGEYPFVVPPLDCTSGDARFEAGRIYVICGTRNRFTISGTTTTNGGTFMNVHVTAR